MRPDDMLVAFNELAVKEPDLMRLVLQASVAAFVDVQSVEVVDAELERGRSRGIEDTCVLVPLNFTSTYHSIAIVLVRTDR